MYCRNEYNESINNVSLEWVIICRQTNDKMVVWLCSVQASIELVGEQITMKQWNGEQPVRTKNRSETIQIWYQMVAK